MSIDTSDKLLEPSVVITEVGSDYYSDVFSPGESKEQLEIGKQVKGSTSKFKVATFAVPATGALVITGVGFKPNMLTILSSNGTATPRIVQSTGYSDGTTTTSQYIWQDTLAPNYVSSINYSWIIYLENGGTNTRASVTSFDTDGFTLNVVSLGVTGSTFSYIAQA